MMMPALIIGIALICYFVRLLDLPLGLGNRHPRPSGDRPALRHPDRLCAACDFRLGGGGQRPRSRRLAFHARSAPSRCPIIQPTIVGAALIALSISLDDFVITFFTIGGGNTLPTLVWGLVRTSLDPTINAMATLLILLSIGSTVLALQLSRYRG